MREAVLIFTIHFIGRRMGRVTVRFRLRIQAWGLRMRIIPSCSNCLDLCRLRRMLIPERLGWD